MLLGLKYEQWLAFSLVAALISTFGSLLGLYLKEYFFARSFESWKQRKSLERIYEKYRDPILLAGRELCSRLGEILAQYPTVYLNSAVLDSCPTNQLENSIDDLYFQKYKLVSTTYRICAFFGWIELYRQELVFLDSGRDQLTNALEKCIESIRADFADGHLNEFDDWEDWKDRLIFREELRAIGEVMLHKTSEGMSVMGYARFCELLESSSESSLKRWLAAVNNFVLDLDDTGLDFRKERLKRLVVHLFDLLELLDDKPPEKRFLELRKKHASAI